MRVDLVVQYSAIIQSDCLVFGAVGDIDLDRFFVCLEDVLVGFVFAGESVGTSVEFVFWMEFLEECFIGCGEQVHIVMGFIGLQYFDPDRVVLDIFMMVLFGQGGRFFLELWDRESLVYSVIAVLVEGLGYGYVYVYMGISLEKVFVGRAGLEWVLGSLIRECITQGELEWVQCYIVGTYDVGFQWRVSRVGVLAYYVFFDLLWLEFGQYMEWVMVVIVDEVLVVAQWVLDSEWVVVCIFEFEE